MPLLVALALVAAPQRDRLALTLMLQPMPLSAMEKLRCMDIIDLGGVAQALISGLLDNQNPTATELRLFNALGTTHKAMLKIQCASHNALWEGSAESGWSGPHAAVTDAAVQWITAASYNGHDKGTFTMDSAGAVRQDGR